MTTLASTSPAHVLLATEGHALASGGQAIVKGALEAETPVSLIAGPRDGAFADVFHAAQNGTVMSVMRAHATRLLATADACRGLALACQASRSGRGAIALIPNAQLDEAMQELARARSVAPSRGGACCVVLEDHPRSQPASCPRQAAARLDLAAIECGSTPQLRDVIDQALLLSRAARCIVCVIVHASILHSVETLEVRPNRAGRVVEVLHARRRRRARIGVKVDSMSPGAGSSTLETSGLLRMARRLELNRFRSVPSPGERLPVGFITIGPADGSLMHLVNVLQLHGRVPILQLQLINPIDDAAVGRLLARCGRVLVLEPRPGVMELRVLAIAEQMRQRGESPASVWGRRVPHSAESGTPMLESDDDLHPSILARKITHLLHEIRPSIQIASQLAPDPPAIARPVPRDAGLMTGAALAAVRRVLRDVDQWLHDRAPLQERGLEATSLALDGSDAGGQSPRSVMVEAWEHERFLRDGPAAIVQAARDDRPWILMACETAGEDVADLERLARGVIPAERADRTTLESANFDDLDGLRDLLREATMRDGLTIVIVRDGPPAQFDVAAIAQSVAQTDKLGFEPRQRVRSSADEICALRPGAIDSEQPSPPPGQASFRTVATVERVSERLSATFRLRIKPVLEEVEVTRIRPPRLRWREEANMRLPSPRIVHGQRALWRAHLAGCRGDAPGAAAGVLSEAARRMGYHVQLACDPTPAGPGRIAWTQLLFTRPVRDAPAPDYSAVIPFGEADLLLGLDVQEAIRAVAPDAPLRVASAHSTSAIVNAGALLDEREAVPPPWSVQETSAVIAAVSLNEGRMTADIAAACRAWFHTDRVTDMALLGAAYQNGFIPISADAMEAGLVAGESQGFGRCREAFEFGRRLALDDRLLTESESDQDLPLDRVARRLALSMRRGVPGSAGRARQLATLMLGSLEQMPGLAETDLGRQSRRDFIMACHHCAVWGGLQLAETYADLITRLYQVDRGDTGRALTRNAALPLAEAMLIRDPLYIAGLAASGEHRRRLRQRLHAKRARGDEIERRYLTRIDLLAFSRRVRIDLRTSDWPARLASATRRIVPRRFRGTRRERLVRDQIIEVVRRAIVESPSDYDRWAGVMQRLHDQAIEDRLRGMALAEIRMLVGGSMLAAASE